MVSKSCRASSWSTRTCTAIFVNSANWPGVKRCLKIRQLDRQVTHESSAWRGLQKIKSGPGAGIPWRPGRYFQIVSSFCAFSTLFVIERKVQQWFFEVLVYSKHTNLVGHWLGCRSRQPGVRGEVALGWGIIHSQFLQVKIHKFTKKKELVAHLQQQPASEEFVRSCRHPWLLSLGKLCKDFRDKLQLIIKMHGEDFQGFKMSILSDCAILFRFWTGWARWQFPAPSGGGREAVLSSRHFFPREFLSLTWTRGYKYRWNSICSKYSEISRSSRLHVFGWKKFLLKS